MKIMQNTHYFSIILFSTIMLSLLINCTEATPYPKPIPKIEKVVETCEKDKIQHAKLINVAQAFDLLDTPDHLFIEVSKKSEYNKGHLANAINVWRPEFRTKLDIPYTGMRSSGKELISFLQNIGMDSETSMIIYDTKGGSDAFRLAWVLDYYGFENYKVINGGKKSWAIAGYPLSTKQRTIEKNKDFTFAYKENKNILATHEEVLNAIRDTNYIIIDTREDYEYLGQCFVHQGEVLSYKKGAFDRGCIPNAIHFNWSNMSDLTNDHRIKCLKDLKFDLAQKAISKNKNIIVYCQSGSRSSHTAFVLKEILEYPNVKNYDGSWIEWSYLSKQNKTPIQKLTSEEDFETQRQLFSTSL